MRSAARLLTVLPAVVVALLLIGPQQLGGPVAAVSTFGESMQPSYQPHDLVVIRREVAYEAGDVVAYHSAILDTVVLHRIVDVDSGRFVTKGDNNDWLDPDRPTAAEVIGREWVRVPGAGRLLDLPMPLRIALPLAVAAALVLAPGARQRAKRRKRPRRPADEPTGRDARPPLHWSGLPTRLATAGAALTVAGAVLAGLAFSHPTTAPAEVTYEHRANLGYEARVPTGPVYPDGRVDTDDPIFLRLVDRLPVTLDWTLHTDAAVDIRSETQLVAVVADGSGWHTTIPLAEPQVWNGTATTLSGELDFAAIRRLVDRVAEETGAPASSRTIDVTADITVQGDLEGQPLDSSFAPTFRFRLDDHTAALVAPAVEADDEAALHQQTETGTVEVAHAGSARLGIAGRTLPVATARSTASAAIALGLVLVGLAGTVAWRRRRWDEHARIADRYRGELAEVAALSPAGERSFVRIPTIAQLVALARARELPVLKVPMRNGGHGYVVDDLNARYRYLIPPAAEPHATRPSLTQLPSAEGREDERLFADETGTTKAS